MDSDDLLPNLGTEYVTPEREAEMQHEADLIARVQGAGLEFIEDQLRWLEEWEAVELTIANLEPESSVPLESQILAKRRIVSVIQNKRIELTALCEKYVKS